MDQISLEVSVILAEGWLRLTCIRTCEKAASNPSITLAIPAPQSDESEPGYRAVRRTADSSPEPPLLVYLLADWRGRGGKGHAAGDQPGAVA